MKNKIPFEGLGTMAQILEGKLEARRQAKKIMFILGRQTIYTCRHGNTVRWYLPSVDMKSPNMVRISKRD
jgi:hypothetical protein